MEAQTQAKEGNQKYLCYVIPCSTSFLISSLDLLNGNLGLGHICFHNKVKTNMERRLFVSFPDTAFLVSSGSPFTKVTVAFRSSSADCSLFVCFAHLESSSTLFSVTGFFHVRFLYITVESDVFLKVISIHYKF